MGESVGFCDSEYTTCSLNGLKPYLNPPFGQSSGTSRNGFYDWVLDAEVSEE